MFSLVQGFYREATHVPERRVILLGLAGSGKTSVLEWLKSVNGNKGNDLTADEEKLAKIGSTVGLNVTTIRYNSSPQRLLIWDLGGGEKLRPIWEPYLLQADALVWCVDTTDTEKGIEESGRVLGTLVNRPRFQGKPLLVLANKCEGDNAISAVDLALKLNLVQAADTRSQCIYTVSAKTGTGIRPSFEWLDVKLRNPVQSQSPDSFETTIK